MKKRIKSFALVLGVFCGALQFDSALASRAVNPESRHTGPRPSQRYSVRYSQSASEEVETSKDSSTQNIALGVSTLSSYGIWGGSLSALLPVGQKDFVQLYFSIPSTSASLIIGAAVQYKHSVLDHGNSGLHIGGGVGLGVSGGVFGFNVTALGGVHVQAPGLPQLKLHFDCGPSLTWNASSGTSFSVAPVSGLLGISLLYSL